MRSILTLEVNTIEVIVEQRAKTLLKYFMTEMVGVQKININSDMRMAYRDTLVRVLEENKTEYAVVKLMDEVIDAVQAVVESKIALFNSAGKARV